MKKIVIILLIAVYGCTLRVNASTATYYETKLDIPYYPDAVRQTNSYVREQCVLDIYYPINKKGFATIVWFHAGGLRAGMKAIPAELQKQGVCIVAPNYRLYPRVRAPEYIKDAAAAVAWVVTMIGSYGGNTNRVFISGHSAGGYLASMLGVDPRWLKAHAIDNNRLAGIIALSGHTITHFTVREERGIPGTQPIIDDLAPLYHVRADAPPLILITGDRELEMLGRYEENAYMMRMMKVAGHTETRLYELKGCDHGSMVNAAFPILLKEVRGN